MRALTDTWSSTRSYSCRRTDGSPRTSIPAPKEFHMGTDNSRREFLRAGIAGTAALALSSVDAMADDTPSTGLPQRPLVKTGVKVSIICLGGWNFGSVKDQDEALKIMHTAIVYAINFCYCCWDYHYGGSEEIMGKALAADSGKWRKKLFLMTKFCSREAAEVRKQI